MSGWERQHRVEVWDVPHTIMVYQKSKAVWLAVGDYMGRSIEVKAHNESSAVKRWIEAARSRG
jgi:hypothetical protein